MPTLDKTRLRNLIVTGGDVIHGEDGSITPPVTPAPLVGRGGEDAVSPISGAAGEFRGGDGLVGAAPGGPGEFRGGDGGPTGAGGSGEFRGGDAVAGAGGPAQFRGGDGVVGGSGEFRAGNGTTGVGGPAVFLAGDGTVGGSLVLGSGVGSTGAGGPMTITSGGGPAGGGPLSIVSGGGSGGGPISIVAGTGISFGGTISIVGGDNTGTSGDGGTITLGGGDVTLGTALGDGGSIILSKGTAAGTGSDGVITIDYADWPPVDGTSGQFLSTNGAGVLSWVTAGGGSGDVVGPSSSVDDRIAAFDGVTGKLIKEGTVTATAVASHLTDTANPHSTSIVNIGSGTLAQLNTAITDATLDDSSASRPPSGSAGGDLGGTYPSPTVNDGADSTAIHDNISGEIAAVAVKATPVSADLILIEDSAAANVKKHITVGSLPTSGGDVVGPSSVIDDRITAFDGVTGKLIKQGTVTATAVASHLSDTANPHSTSIVNIGSGTLAQLNTAITDATLDDSSASRPPSGSAGGDLGGSYPSPTVNDGADSTAIHDNVASEISAIAVKAVPVSGDFLVIEDSAAGNVKKHILIGSLPSGSVTNLQTAYIGGNTIVTDTTNGDFDVSGSEAISLDAAMASNFTVTGANLTLATVTSGGILISGANGITPGTVLVSGGDGTGAGNDGADLSVISGSGSAGSGNAGGDAGIIQGSAGSGGVGGTTFDGGAGGGYQWATGTGGTGGATSGAGGAAGNFAWVGADGGAADGGGVGGAASSFIFTAGDGGAGVGLNAGGAAGGFTFTTGTSGIGASATVGGDFQFTGADGGSMGGAFLVDTGAATNANGIGGEIALTAGNNDVASASGDGGGITATAGSLTDENSTGNGGNINLISGSARQGNPGTITLQTGTHDADTGSSISLLTEGLSGPVRLRTSTGFVGTEVEHRSFGSQETVGGGTSNVVVTLKTLSTNGRNVKLDVLVSAQDSTVASDMASAHFVQTFYRNAGSVTAMTAHIASNEQTPGWTSIISFNLVPAGDDINLEIANASGSTEIGNVSVQWTAQEGGFSS